MLIQLADLSFSYPGNEMFSGVSFQVNPGDRVGLVGPNGAGKSTLLRLMAGELAPDSGQVVLARGKTLAYMHQSQEFHGQGTLWDALLLPFAPLLRLREEIARLEHEISAAHERGDEGTAETLLDRYGHLQEEYTRKDGYTLEVRAKLLAKDLGFSDDDLARGVDTLSGGERGRVELAKVVLLQPDVLLLDEPTNHLDVDAVEHLEERLAAWDGSRAFVVVSHDRYFLKAVCRDIVDVEGTGLVRYAGGYEKYVGERAARHERLNAAFQRQQEEIAKTEDFIRRNIAGQKTKQAQSRRKMLEKMDRLTAHRDEWEEAGRIGLRFNAGEHRGGKEAIRCEAVTMGYAGGLALVKDLTTTIYRGDRVGIVGPNGAGKSTLLKGLIGKLQPRQGMIHQGHEIRIGYFDQKLSDLDEDHSLIDEIRTVRGDWNADVARQYLGRFRFSGDDGLRKVKGLSGGERNRLTLAKMMLMPRNLLALDEPTNHLDIPACEVLEEALQNYEGSVLVVSHDRFFLDRVVNKIFHLDPQTGRVEEHVGNYSDWKQRLAAEAQKKKDLEARALTQKAPAKKIPERAKTAEQLAAEAEERERQQRLADRQAKKDKDREREKKQRRLQQLEGQIAEAEAESARLSTELAGEHGNDWQRLNGLVAEQQKVADRLARLMAEWERLGEELA